MRDIQQVSNEELVSQVQTRALWTHLRRIVLKGGEALGENKL